MDNQKSSNQSIESIKKKKNIPITTILLVITILGMSFYIMYEKELIFSNIKVQDKKENKTQKGEKSDREEKEETEE